MTYNEFISALQQLTALTDASGLALMNSLSTRIIEATELRILREPEFDFLATRIADISQQTTTGMRSVPIPSAFLVVEGAALITPSGKASPSQTDAKRIPMLRTSRPHLDIVWPVESKTRAPDDLADTYFALFSEEVAAPSDPTEPVPGPSALLIAPTPDAIYQVEITGTQRPAPLSSTNSPTFLTTHLPDLYLASAMVFVSGGILRNYGMQADDPKMALSWLAVYGDLKRGVEVEELRKRALVDGGLTRYAGRSSGAPPNLAMLGQMQQQAAPAMGP